jgi:hypothetical protein
MQHQDGAQQQTFSLSLSSTTNDFHGYITSHKLLWFQIAKVASVPAITVWGIDHGLYVTREHADLVRQALKTLTGVPFTGQIPVLTDKHR